MSAACSSVSTACVFALGGCNSLLQNHRQQVLPDPERGVHLVKQNWTHLAIAQDCLDRPICFGPSPPPETAVSELEQKLKPYTLMSYADGVTGATACAWFMCITHKNVTQD